MGYNFKLLTLTSIPDKNKWNKITQNGKFTQKLKTLPKKTLTKLSVTALQVQWIVISVYNLWNFRKNHLCLTSRDKIGDKKTYVFHQGKQIIAEVITIAIWRKILLKSPSGCLRFWEDPKFQNYGGLIKLIKRIGWRTSSFKLQAWNSRLNTFKPTKHSALIVGRLFVAYFRGLPTPSIKKWKKLTYFCCSEIGRNIGIQINISQTLFIFKYPESWSQAWTQAWT